MWHSAVSCSSSTQRSPFNKFSWHFQCSVEETETRVPVLVTVTEVFVLHLLLVDSGRITMQMMPHMGFGAVMHRDSCVDFSTI